MADSTCSHVFFRTDDDKRWKCYRCDKTAKRPLPNGVIGRGDQCPKSFAGYPENHMEPHPEGVEGWGVCKDCGAVLSLKWRDLARQRQVPPHDIPKAKDAR